MVKNSITFVDVYPPAYIPRVEDARAAPPLLKVVTSPKSTAFPVDASVT
jgi:hypothetical protein